jgi:hypothetical protein
MIFGARSVQDVLNPGCKFLHRLADAQLPVVALESSSLIPASRLLEISFLEHMLRRGIESNNHAIRRVALLLQESVKSDLANSPGAERVDSGAELAGLDQILIIPAKEH